MPAFINRKIPLFASRVDSQNLALGVSNHINITNFSDGYVATNANGTTNQIKDMFDNKFSTSFRIAASSITDSEGEKGQLIINVGRQIKPRQIKVTFASIDNDADVEVFFANSLTESGTPITGNVAQATLDIDGDGDPDGIFEGVDFGSLGTVDTQEDPDGTITSGLHQLSINKEFFDRGTFDDSQYIVFLFSNPGGQSLTEPEFIDITQIEIFETFDIRDFDVEFDDALLSQKGWINPRYEGSKLKVKTLNKYTGFVSSDSNIPEIGIAQVGINFVVGQGTFWPGDTVGPFGQISMISNRTTALYYATTVIGGTDDPQYATIKGHSYIKIQKIFIINKDDQSITVIDRDTQGTNVGSETGETFNSFHRYITNDFPTGAELNIKILDNSVSSDLQNSYHCKMNKGFLLKSFDFNYEQGPTLKNNTLYFYSGSRIAENLYVEGAEQDVDFEDQIGLRFRYALNETSPPVTSFGISIGGGFSLDESGPNFASSSIIENKFTKQYYSGSFGFIIDNPEDSNLTIADNYARSGIGSASKFIGVDTLDFLKSNFPNTELHITFFDGTKDFAPGFNDERSISTFEISANQTALKLGDECNAFLPKNHELIIKGNFDDRFRPLTKTIEGQIAQGDQGEELFSGFLAKKSDGTCDNANPPAATIDHLDQMAVYVQGGTYGPEGNVNFRTSNTSPLEPNEITEDNLYSGSFNYELSFLDKDHTLIVDLDRDAELPDGIGNNGIILMPEHLDHQVKNNLDFYMQQISNLLQLPGGGGSDDAINFNN